MTVHSPEQTSAWTETDWAGLAGKVITVITDNGPIERERRTRSVRFGLGSTVVIEWVGGGSLTFVHNDPGTTIEIHEEQS